MGDVFRFTKKIGNGTYSNVYEAIDDNDKHVAVKSIKNSKIVGYECLMEASVMSSMSHPNLNSAKMIHVTDTRMYIIQKLASSDLNTWRKKYVPDTQRKRLWIHQLLQAIQCLHQQNLIHCDIKGANILVSKSERKVRLGDFTLIMMKKYVRNFKHRICTETHRPPEVWLKREWNTKVDIWSLGCTIFEFIYGYSLFPPQNENADKYLTMMFDWYNMNPIKISEPYYTLNKRSIYTPINLPESFSENDPFDFLIMKMLQLNPDDRPDVSDLLDYPFFNGLKKVPYILTNHSYEPTPSSILVAVKSNLSQKTKNKDIQEFALKIYDSIYGLKRFKNEDKINMCLWLSYKMIAGAKYDLIDLDNKKIFRYEKRICKYLGFRLPIFSF